MTLDELRKLAGINAHSVQSTEENISKTAHAIRQKEKKMGIKPGDPDWFKLWFSRPYMTGPVQFRSRKKSK
jgi:hypothetical protein